MPDPYHDHRAARAGVALEAYRSALGEARVDIDTVRDLAQDILHWIAREHDMEAGTIYGHEEEDLIDPIEVLRHQIELAVMDFPQELAAGPNDQGDETPIGEPPQDDTVKCCPDCGKPNQFGETCPACERNEQERIEEAREQPAATEDGEYTCPACGEVGNVDVEIKCWARVCYSDGAFSGTVPDEAEQGEHEWGDESGMVCRACGHEGRVFEFQADPAQ